MQCSSHFPRPADERLNQSSSSLPAPWLAKPNTRLHRAFSSMRDEFVARGKAAIPLGIRALSAESFPRCRVGFFPQPRRRCSPPFRAFHADCA
jgi:hypothetical protein